MDINKTLTLMRNYKDISQNRKQVFFYMNEIHVGVLRNQLVIGTYINITFSDK